MTGSTNGRLVPDRAAISAAVSLLTHGSPGIIEVRAFGCKGQGTISGYFDQDHLRDLTTGVTRIGSEATGIYVTLNPVDPKLIARYSNHLQPRAAHATSDKDVVQRMWLPIDIDAVRPSGISANDEEKERAKRRASEVRQFLISEGFPEPIAADSGNGFHLLFRIDLPQDDGSLVERCLKGLAFVFNDQDVIIDASIGNAARIWKLYGTVVRKGDNVPERPHRLAKVLHVPEVLEVTPKELLKRIADLAPQAPMEPASRRRQQSDFDLSKWMQERCPDAFGPLAWPSGQKWIFPICPWNSAHTNRAAFVVQFQNGGIAAGCHHNGCDGNDWRALRALREPGWKPYQNVGERPSPVIQVVSESEEWPYSFDDHGDADYMAATQGHRLRFCDLTDQWYIWDGIRWAPDNTLGIIRIAVETAKQMLIDVGSLSEIKVRKDAAYRAMRLQEMRHLNRLISELRAWKSIAVTPNEFDQDPWVINCMNGTVDLRTGKLKDHNPADNISKLAPVDYNPEAVHSLWEDLLQRVTGGSEEIHNYLQKAAGYSLTGSTREEKIFILVSQGGGGKTSFLETMAVAMGDYAMPAEQGTFLRRAAPGGHSEDVATLAGARLVLATELGKGRLAEEFVKRITGGEAIRASRKHGHSFSFRPQFTLWIAAQVGPSTDGADSGMWRRLRKIPWVPIVNGDETVKERLLGEKEAHEAALAWMVKGCLNYQNEGLKETEAVVQATEAYRQENNSFIEYQSEYCSVGPWHWVRSDDLRKDYEIWCRGMGYEPIGGRVWADALRQLGCSPKSRKIRGRVIRGWQGIDVRGDSPTGEDEPGQLPLEVAPTPTQEASGEAEEEGHDWL